MRSEVTPELHRRENLRRSFRPPLVRLLFIGESPPASGRFFFQRDSGLYRAMRDAFQSVDPSIADENFLAVFQSSGCYLIDLCAEPVDNLDPQSRRRLHRASEASLSKAIERLQPAKIATLLRSIERTVAEAARRANWHGPFLHLPYPGRWSKHRISFIATLAPAIADLL